jgi:carbon-monoxide dehydrogenase small subunit
VPDPTVPVAMTVNGAGRTLEVVASHTLLDVLRDRLGLTGTKECCAEGECGACTVILDGVPVNSCLVLAAEADGGTVLTVEGLASEGRPNDIQDAFVAAGAVQCGFCIPGMVVSAHALLAERPDATAAEIREGLSGNLCRCGGYVQIGEAVAAARDARASGR